MKPLLLGCVTVGAAWLLPPILQNLTEKRLRKQRRQSDRVTPRSEPGRPEIGPRPIRDQEARTEVDAAQGLERVLRALSTLDALLLLAIEGDNGRAQFLAALETGGGATIRDVKATSAAMRRLAIILSVSDGADMATPDPGLLLLRGDEIDSVAGMWMDFTVALRCLMSACQSHAAPRNTAASKPDHEALLAREAATTAAALEQLCLSLARLGLRRARGIEAPISANRTIARGVRG